MTPATTAPVGYTTGSTVSTSTPVASTTKVVAGTATSLSIFGYSSNVTSGTSFKLIISALDADGNIATGYRGTVRFTSTDTSSPALPSNYTFTSDDAGVHFVNAGTLNGAGSQTITINDVDSGSISTATASVTVTAATVSATVSAVSASPSSVTADGVSVSVL